LRIAFLTGTRADFGKLKPLIQVLLGSEKFELSVLITGMHLLEDFGSTYIEVEENFPEICYRLPNSALGEKQDLILARTITQLHEHLDEYKYDLFVIHGDRIETLAGATAALLNNIPSAHIEGGELSGTVDEMLRHAITKLSTFHLVSNEKAKKRIRQMGEAESSIFILGSPDIDLIKAKTLPDLEAVLKYYQIPWEDFGIVLYHPVVTDLVASSESANNLVESLIQSNKNWVVIYPNNDPGYSEIMNAYRKLGSHQFRLIPSMRFEYFLTLLESSKLILGNSSAGIMEAPVFGIPTIDIGSRQTGRSEAPSITKLSSPSISEILQKIELLWGFRYESEMEFGDGNSASEFLRLVNDGKLRSNSIQKQFYEL
jgi:UDP-N-acetylglucosamine 2-epimerase (hydrolysing)